MKNLSFIRASTREELLLVAMRRAGELIESFMNKTREKVKGKFVALITSQIMEL